MPSIGTAGHVDHGKSALVLALTGRRQVVAGGVVIDPRPISTQSEAIALACGVLNAGEDERATALLVLRREDSLAAVSADSQEEDSAGSSDERGRRPLLGPLRGARSEYS